METPLVFIDALDIDQPGGPRTAVFNLLMATFKELPTWRFVTYLSVVEPSFNDFPNVKQISINLGNRKFSRIIFQILLIVSIFIKKPHIVHFTKSVPLFAPGAKRILTIFDVTTLAFPDFHTKGAVLFWQLLLPRLAKTCDQIIAISNTVANDIHNLLGANSPPIQVVYCASQFSLAQSDRYSSIDNVKNRFGLPKSYLLAVGQIAIKKNLGQLIKAYALLVDDCINNLPPLILAGPLYEQSNDIGVFDLIRQMNLENKIRYIGRIDFEDLPSLYSGATIFLMPSLHEGFGIPCVEAMQFNVPVIASKAAALPEIIGDAGILIEDYTNPVAWAQSIELVLKDHELRAKLVKIGSVRYKDFSWEKSAKTLSNIYREMSN